MSEQIKASRRGILKAGLTVLAGTVAVTTAARAQDADTKVDQATVAYQNKPNDDGTKCSVCVNFQAPNACKVVLGNISPEGWCTAFAPKKAP